MIRPSDSMHAAGKLWRITGLESKLRFRLDGEGEVRLPHAPEILFEDKTNPLFATVVNGICYITAGNYEVVYEATEKLKKNIQRGVKAGRFAEPSADTGIFVDDDRGGYDTGCGLWMSFRQVAEMFSGPME